MEMSLAKVANEFTAKNDRSKKFWNPSIEIPNAATVQDKKIVTNCQKKSMKLKHDCAHRQL